MCMESEDREYRGLIFRETCFACPESYDVIDKDGRKIGYVRLRFGYLRAERVDTDEIIYEYTFDDDWKGMFADEAECDYHLSKIADALIDASGIK